MEQRATARLQPSFPVTVDLEGFNRDSEVTLEAVARSPAGAAGVLRTADALHAALVTGMFSVEPGAATEPAQLVSADRLGDMRIRYVWRLAGVQSAAFRVLLDMLEVHHQRSQSLTSVALRCLAGNSPRWHEDEIVGGPFPLTPPSPPFVVALKPNLDDSKDPVVRFEFQQRLRDDDLQALDRLFLAWDAVVVRGGYLQNLEDVDANLDIEESLSSRQTYLASPTVVEHVLYEFVGASAAFDAVVNMAIRIHHHWRQLVRIEVE